MLLALVPAALAGTPSPADWRDLVIYQLVTDRFANGSTANDAVEGNYAPADGSRIHGGDFAGLTARLDYLVNLGVDAVWIAPVVLNANAEYHGYAARDFFSIAPHFGTLAELRAFVQAAHARSIRVIIDVVCNHMGSLITSSDPDWPDYRYPAGYTLAWADPQKRFAGAFDDLAKFHPYGSIGTYTDPEQILGQLFGLNDLKTEDAVVRTALVQAAQFLIDSTDCDGFRVDTVKHVEMGFWSEWCSAVRLHAATRGKTHFLMFGEVWDGSDAKVGSYTGTVGGGAYKFDSMLHYPLYFTANGVFAYADPPAALPARYADLDEYDASTRERLATFLDNHDNSRFLGAGIADQDESRLEAALTWLLTSRGVPILYYGTEQGFDGGGDPWCREDMWAGQWNFGPSLGDNYDQAHLLFRRVRAVIEARRRHEALRRGTTTTLYAETAGPGLYAYRRESATDSALVAVNSSNLPLTQVVTSAWPQGTPLVDALEPAYGDVVGAGGSLTVRLPARGARIYESLAARAATLPGADALHVESVSPAHDRAVNDRWSPLRVTFDRAVDPPRLVAAFAITPAASGVWQVAGREARYFPHEPWAAGVTYDWALDTSLVATDGTRLPARFDARFRTVAYSTGITVPAGHVADRIARQNLTAPEGILPAPWLGPDVLLVADARRDRVFELTLGGDLGHHLGDSRWTRPEALARPAGEGLAVADAAGLFTVDAFRLTSQAIGVAGPTTTGALAAGSGDFLDRLYLCDPANDRVVRTTAAGDAYETFAAGVKGGEGLAFGPGGAWGTDLFVGDCDLTSLGTGADGPGRVARVTAAGAVSTVVQSALLLRAGALAFDTGGRFGGDLFAADIVNERILRITSAGAVSVFATGFANLAGSNCLAFGADGALYVADPGAGESFSRPGGSVAQGQVIRISPAVLTAEVPRGTGGGLELAPPAPNPARGAVRLRFTLPAAGRARLALYDLAGRRVATLVDGPLAAGGHEATWTGEAAAGLYFARLEAGEGAVTRRIARVR